MHSLFGSFPFSGEETLHFTSFKNHRFGERTEIRKLFL